MKTAIIGAGGVGGYFGARIAKAGHEVLFVARGENLKAMQAKGLSIKSIQGDFKLEKVNCTDKISDLVHSDLIILAVKAWQVKDLALQLRNIIATNTFILPLQNGVLAVEELRQHIDEKKVLGGLCRIMSKIESPGVIDHFAIEPKIIFGETDRSISERLRKVQELLSSSQINAIVSEDIESDLWKKFIPICVSGLLAVTKTTYGELRELKETRKLMVDLIDEIYAISQKIGIYVEPEFPANTIAYIDSYPYDSTSSLTRDVWEGKPSEIEYQNGTVVRLGQKYGINTPVNSFVYSCILPMEIKARNKKANLE
jgi:2-dehydropantoate 2-reductase